MEQSPELASGDVSGRRLEDPDDFFKDYRGERLTYLKH